MECAQNSALRLVKSCYDIRMRTGWIGIWALVGVAHSRGRSCGLWPTRGATGRARGLFGGRAVVGAMQWLVMRRQTSRPGWRVLASMGGYGVGFAAAHAIRHAGVGPVGLGFVVAWAAYAIVSALIARIALVRLLRQGVPESLER